MKHKLFTLFLALVVGVGTIYASDTQVNGIWYDFHSPSKTASVTFQGSARDSYMDEYTGAVVIPSTVEYNGETYTVTEIGTGAFYKCTSLTSVSLPNSIKVIGATSFLGCSGITNITFPDSLDEISNGAFYTCTHLQSVTLPETVTKVGTSAFRGCYELASFVFDNLVTEVQYATFADSRDLASVVLSENTKLIDRNAFANCRYLTSITIPMAVDSIGDKAFINCKKLESITCESKTPPAMGDSVLVGLPASATIYVPSSAISAYQAAKGWSDYNIIENPSPFPDTIQSVQVGDLWYNLYPYTREAEVVTSGGDKYTGNIVIPSKVRYEGMDYSVTSIGSWAFYGCYGLTNITIPNSVTSIGSSAFSGCYGLTNITIPNSVTSIGSYAFSSCSGLTHINISETVTSIGENAFAGCKLLTSISLPIGITDIAPGTFAGCYGLVSVDIPNTVTNIGRSAFKDCIKLSVVEIPASVNSVGFEAFMHCKNLTSISIPYSITSWDASVFDQCTNIKQVYVNSNAVIEKNKFASRFGVQVEQYIVGDSVTDIPANLFENCTSLKRVTIGSNVKSMGKDAFSGCDKIDTIIWNAKSCTIIGASPFSASSTNVTSFTFGEEVKNIPESLCNGMSKLSTMTIPNSVEKVGENVFSGCSIRTITIGNVKSVSGGKIDFGGSSIYFTGTPEEWCTKSWYMYRYISTSPHPSGSGYKLYIGGEEITDFEVPESVTSISNNAFYLCEYLKKITITKNVKQIGENAFYGCQSLHSVFILGPSTDIVKNAFSACYIIKNVTINSNTIAGKDYSNTDNLNNVFGKNVTKCVFGDSVKHIGKYIFYDNDRKYNPNSLKYISIGKNVESIGDYAFNWNTTDGLLNDSIVICANLKSIGSGAWGNRYFSQIIYKGTLIQWLTKSWRPSRISNTYSLEINGEKISNVVIPDEVTSIAEGAFCSCANLHSLIIPDGVTDVKASAFMQSGLIKVSIGSGITYIGSKAFYNCWGLDSVICRRNIPPQIGSDVFSSSDTPKYPICVPCGAKSAYMDAWPYYSKRISHMSLPYSITAGPNISNAGRIDVPMNICENTMTAVSNYGYHFVQWNDGNTDNPRTIELIQDTTFTAEFVKNTYSVKTQSANIDWGSTYGDGTTFYLDAIWISASANYGYHFTQWSDGNADNPRRITLTKDTTFTAEFAKNNYSIYVQADELQGTIHGGGTFEYLDLKQIEAIPNYGYHFVQWTDGNMDNPRTIELTKNTTLTAKFAKNNYTIYVQFDETQGTINGGGLFEYLDLKQIEAVSNYGYHFVQWTDGNTDNPRAIKLTKDTAFTATFAKNTYSIYVQADELQGTIHGGGTFEYLDLKQIEAIPNYGYHFVQWTDGNTDNPRTIELTKDTTFTAEFAKNTYSVTTEVANPERGTTIGDSVAFYLDEMQISASANYGYHFAQWSDGNVDNPRTIVLTKDTTFTAEFAKNNYSIYVQADELQGTIHGGGTFEYLDLKQIEAIPNYGYHFVQWSDGIIDNPRTIELTKDTTFTATFAVDVTGVCGDDNLLTWAFDADSKTLTIYGDGQLNSNYTYGVQAPEQTERLIIEKGITSIGNAAFEGMCSTIITLVLPSTVTSIGDYAFAGMSNRQFKTLALPNTIKYIGAYAFDGAAYLQTIHFGSTLEEIGAYAFNGCTRVKEMTCLAEITPNVGQNGLTSISSLAELHVPADYLTEYQLDNNWNRFLVKPMGTSETTTEEDKVIVVTDDNTATFTWPTNPNAASYTIQITKDGEVFCTLVFNANGQLTGIAFAPSRDNSQQTQAATMEQNAAQFTVTGLTFASKYGYRLEVTNASMMEIVSYSGEFATTGYVGEVNQGGEPEYNPQGLSDVQSDDVQCTKVIRNGQIFIEKNGKTYDILGTEVK